VARIFDWREVFRSPVAIACPQIQVGALRLCPDAARCSRPAAGDRPTKRTRQARISRPSHVYGQRPTAPRQRRRRRSSRGQAAATAGSPVLHRKPSTRVWLRVSCSLIAAAPTKSIKVAFRDHDCQFDGNPWSVRLPTIGFSQFAGSKATNTSMACPVDHRESFRRHDAIMLRRNEA
jgi:ribosomal protein L44E